MKLDIQYLNDGKGNVSAVQLPVTDWNKVLARLHKYDQILKMKSDLTEAFAEVEQLRSLKTSKQTLTEFLDEL